MSSKIGKDLFNQKPERALDNEDVKRLLEKLREQKNTNGCFDSLYRIFIYLLFIPPYYLWFGFVVMSLWNWFVPLPPIGLIQATGFWLFFNLFKYNLVLRTGASLEEEKQIGLFLAMVQRLAFQFFSGLIPLMIGGFLSLFI